jgi:ectoine hydroxylase-related dioxygenase (phytanoyl-CoA dioxygenase family)
MTEADPMSTGHSLPATLDDRDWSALTLGERIRQIEVEGYLVLPDLLSPAQVARVKTLTAGLETGHADYSERQRSRPDVHWDHPDLAELVAHPPTVAFLTELLGPEIVFLGATYARSEPGHPGISLHTDGQPYGSQIFGHVGSCPVQVRVLYYLDDLTPDVSPFLVVPRSHLSLHADANPYRRYRSHPEQVMVPARAGSAVLLNHRCFHGNYPNTGTRPREMLAYLYRPAWAGPTDQKIPTWDADKVAALPPHVRRLFADRNTRLGFDYFHKNKPDHMASEAPGISPSRWQRLK